MTPPNTAPSANNLEAFFMPFTANRQFKKNPRLLAKAKGVHYWTPEGRKIIDGTAGLWCVNAGHGREEIKAAIARQLDEMDYAPSFQMGHPMAFELAARHAALLPGDLNHAFYCNSGSEAVDSALRIALAYHRANGQGTRTRFVGRERGYHGVGFGGISVGGMVNNRKWFGAMLPGVDHLPHTHLAKNAFSKGQPEHGAELADALEGIVGLHDASNIAAVIVEPCAGSTGYLPPPKGYLERLRQICDKHGILLIFDEVLFERSAELSSYWEEGVHSLKGLPNVTDIRNLGLAAGIDLAPKGPVGTRGYEAFTKAFELGLMVRQSGDAIAMSPPLVIEKSQIDEIIDLTAKTIKAVA